MHADASGARGSPLPPPPPVTLPPLASLLPAGPDGIFAALAVHLAHKARGAHVEFRPNTVWAPEPVEALNLQVGGGCCGRSLHAVWETPQGCPGLNQCQP